MIPYFDDGQVTLFLGDCREIPDWLEADVLCTDPPYGRGWRQGRTRNDGKHADDSHGGIVGDEDTTVRDAALTLWGERPGAVFGDFMLAPPAASNSRSLTSSLSTPADTAQWLASGATSKPSTWSANGQAGSAAGAASYGRAHASRARRTGRPVVTGILMRSRWT